LGKIARIESTTNFMYDMLEFKWQGNDLVTLQTRLSKSRKTTSFQKSFSKNNPKVSVIIPISRPLSVSLRSIESVLRQSYTNFELILVCESKNTDLENWIRKLGDKRIILEVLDVESVVSGLWSKWAVSGARSRNHGMEIASGDFFTFLDDDDLMLENKILRCVEVAKSNNSEFLAHHESSINSKNDELLRLNKIFKTRRYHSGSVDYFGLGSNVIFLHKFFLQVKWPLFNYKNLRGNDSVYVRMILSLNPKFEFIPEVLSKKS